MESLVERVYGRPLKLFGLDAWRWEEPNVEPFTLLVAAHALPQEMAAIRHFATKAIASGCAYVCLWGNNCELVHDLFDAAAMAASADLISTWHEDESLAETLYYALVVAHPGGDQPITAAPVVLAVQHEWRDQVRALLADQDELARLWIAEEN